MAQQPGRAGGERIPCPRCRANNFLGQTHCWQCKSSLPPPDATAYPARPVSAPSGYPVAAPVGYPASHYVVPARRVNWLPVAFVALLVCGGVLYMALSRAKSPESRSPERRQPRVAQPAASDEPRTIWVTGPPSQIPDNDPVTDEARRAVERASRELDLPPPNAARDTDGRIRLRSGGVLSEEEWQRARRKVGDSPLVRESPLLKEPPLPPPF
jgi:hypothetical protein